MLEQRFSELLNRWADILPGDMLANAGLQRALRNAFELGVAARSEGLVGDRRDELGELVDLADSVSASHIVTWPCPAPGKYGFLFKAWCPQPHGSRRPADAMIQFGWQKIDRFIQQHFGYWHTSGVVANFTVDDDESTTLTVITQDSPVQLLIQPLQQPGDIALAPPLTLTLDKNQATRRMLSYEVQ